jgi:hypothetical protein
MVTPENDISNLDFPIANVIKETLSTLSADRLKTILGSLTEDEFISHRADIYLQELESAMHSGYDELGAKEIALRECLHGLTEDDGEFLEA